MQDLTPLSFLGCLRGVGAPCNQQECGDRNQDRSEGRTSHDGPLSETKAMLAEEITTITEPTL